MSDELTRKQIDEAIAGADATWARNLTDRKEYERRAAILKRLRDLALSAQVKALAEQDAAPTGGER